MNTEQALEHLQSSLIEYAFNCGYSSAFVADLDAIAAIRQQLADAHAECARLREAMAASEKPDMFWDDDDNERCCESIYEIVSNRWEDGAAIGDTFQVQRAISLTKIIVRIIAVPETDESDEDWDYEIVDAALRGKETP